MPSGLDGHPDPIRSAARDAVLAAIAGTIAREAGNRRICIGVDGAAGTGKSTFADELANVVRTAGCFVVRSTTDSFHRPRADRYRRGRASGEGYYRDSHDLEAIRRDLLDPFVGGRPFRVAAFDEPTDSPVDCEPRIAGPGSVLLFDGLFVHRSELRPYWTFSIYLRAPARLERWRTEAAARVPAEKLADFVSRYEGGWRLYEEESCPETLATWVIDNDQFATPVVTRSTVP